MCQVAIIPVTHQPAWVVLFADSLVSAGFPSPAEDHQGVRLDLNQLLLPNPDSTYLIRVFGDSMTGGESGIRDGALLAVDCRLRPGHDDIVIAVVENEFTVKRLVRKGPSWWLVPDNPSYPSVEIAQPDLFDVWGVVTHVVVETRKGKLSEHVRAR